MHKFKFTIHSHLLKAAVMKTIYNNRNQMDPAEFKHKIDTVKNQKSNRKVTA
jgi:hypothetical protein